MRRKSSGDIAKEEIKARDCLLEFECCSFPDCNDRPLMEVLIGVGYSTRRLKINTSLVFPNENCGRAQFC